ncbi:elongation factor P [Candidatus Uhrbacteria bacterium]|jgi:elongation factor P|nr:elongation factor P [Candidatus Uhrbacteria bacterium]
MASPNDIKKGMIINRNGSLWSVVDFQRVSPGKGGSFVRTKMKNLKTGKVNEENLKASEQLTFEDVSNKKMQFLFNDASFYTFMDTVTYEQVAVATSEIEDIKKFLKEGLEVTISMHEGNPIAASLPQKIQYTVGYTESAEKGDTASGNVLKDAEMDNGLIVRVPAFIHQGDEIMVNTDSGEYSERVSK